MKRKALMLFIISIFLMSVLVGCSTQGKEGILPKQIENVLSIIFPDIKDPSALYGDTNFVIMMKVLFAIALFAILFGASELALKDFSKNIRITLAVLIAIIATILIPSNVLVVVAQTYSFVFFVLLMALPVVGGAYLMYSVFGEPTRTNFIAKFLIAGILYYVLGAFSNVATQVSGAAAGAATGAAKKAAEAGGTIAGLVGFMSFIFFIMMIWYLIRSFTAGPEGAPAAEGVKVSPEARGLMQWWRRRGVTKLFDKAKPLMDNISAAVRAKDMTKLNDALKEEEAILRSFKDTIRRSAADVGTVDESIRTKIEPLIAQMETAERTVERALRAVQDQANAGDWVRARNALSGAETSMRTAISLATTFVHELGK